MELFERNQKCGSLLINEIQLPCEQPLTLCTNKPNFCFIEAEPQVQGNKVAEIPAWLNLPFVEHILSGRAEHDGVVTRAQNGDRSTNSKRLSRIDVKPVPPGENFGSSLYQVRAYFNGSKGSGTSEVAMMFKCVPEAEAMALNVTSSGFFRNEIYMYTEIMKDIRRILDEAAPGRFPSLVPDCIYHQDSPNDLIVLEDLTARGFQVADRKRGLGLRHCLLTLRAMARLHAASAAILGRDPSVASRFICPMRPPDEDPFSKAVAGGFLCLADACEEWPEVPSRYPELLRRMSKTAYVKLGQASRAIPGDFNVIGHGDVWTNNLMFRSENGVPVDIRFLDLQLSYVCSPAVELIYFIYSSLSDDVAENHIELLIREYHVALTETLELLKLKGPSLEELKADMNKHGYFGMKCLVVITPFTRSEQGNEPDMDKALRGEWRVNANVYKTKYCRKWLSKWLVEFGQKGWLQEEFWEN